MRILSFLLLASGIAEYALAAGSNPPTSRPAGITTYTPPTAGVLDGTAFSQWVTTEAAGGATTLALAKGNYNATNPAQPSNVGRMSYINLKGLNGVTLWMDGVGIEMPNNTIMANNIYECNHLTTYGPTFWYTKPGFSQGTVTAVSETSSTSYDITFEIDAGYDTYIVTNGALNSIGVEYVDPIYGRLIPGSGTSTLYDNPVTSVSGQPNTYTFVYNFNQNAHFVPQVGFKLLTRGTYLACNQVQSSNYTTVNDLTLYSCGGFGFYSYYNRRTTINSYTVTPAPFAPPGGSKLPVRSLSADGFHSDQDIVGPVVDSCSIQQNDDDVIAVHGLLAPTSSFPSTPNTFVGNQGASVGDVLEFFNSSTWALVGTATVTAATVTTPFGGISTITVDHLPPGLPSNGTRYSNRNMVGSDFAIRNVLTNGNRGAGVKLKASNGVIENNVFQHNSREAVTLGPEFSNAFGESSYVHNIPLTNNRAVNDSFLDASKSVLSVHGDSLAEGSTDPNQNPIGSNTNITINGFYITGTGSHSSVYFGAASGISATSVEIENYLLDNITVQEATPNALVNFQNVAFTGTVDICKGSGGSVPGVQDIYVYGTAIDAPTSLPQC